MIGYSEDGLVKAFITDTGKSLHVHLGLLGDSAQGSEDGLLKGIDP